MIVQDQQHDMAVFLSRFQATKKQKFPVCVANSRKLLDLCAKIKNNQFAICDEVINSEVGSGIYLNAAMINHSCQPNAFPIFEGKTIHIKALKKIKPGEGKPATVPMNLTCISRNINFVHGYQNNNGRKARGTLFNL